MSSRQFLVLLSVVVFSQAVFFALLWSRLPMTGQDAGGLTTADASTHESILAEIEQLRRMRDSIDLSSGSGAVALPDAQELRVMVRLVLQEELSDLLSDKVSARAIGSEEDVVSQDQRAMAAQVSSQVLDQAINEGEWNERHLGVLLPNLGNLSDEQRQGLAKRFTEALDSGVLKVGAAPPPF